EISPAAAGRMTVRERDSCFEDERSVRRDFRYNGTAIGAADRTDDTGLYQDVAGGWQQTNTRDEPSVELKSANGTVLPHLMDRHLCFIDVLNDGAREQG